MPDDASFRITSFVQIGRLHPGWNQAMLRKDARPFERETAEWCDGAAWWEKNHK